MKNKKIDRTKTIKSILDKCSGRNYNINTKKFNQRKNEDQFLIEAAEFCEVSVIYMD